MKTLVRSFIIALVALTAVACKSSKTTVSQNVDLTKYEYAAVLNNDTYHIPAELMEYEIQLFDAVEASGLKMVNQMRIFDMPSQEQSKLLLVKYGVTVLDEGTIVTVNFIDYLTGRPVVSCQGSYGLGMDYSGDMKGSIKLVAEQIAATFVRK